MFLGIHTHTHSLSLSLFVHQIEDMSCTSQTISSVYSNHLSTDADASLEGFAGHEVGALASPRANTDLVACPIDLQLVILLMYQEAPQFSQTRERYFCSRDRPMHSFSIYANQTAPSDRPSAPWWGHAGPRMAQPWARPRQPRVQPPAHPRA